jgi:hypothetical protein
MKAKTEQGDQAGKAVDYRRFLNQIDIVDVRLVSARIDTAGYAESPPEYQIEVRTRARYENLNNRIEVFHRYNLVIEDTKAKMTAGKLTVVFCVTYSSKIPMNDELFRAFKEYNLFINTWPYFREFVHNTFARMNWTGLVAPLYKGGIRPKKAK